MITMYTRYKLSKAADLRSVRAGVIINPKAGRVKNRYNGDHPFWDVLKPGELVRLAETPDALAGALSDFTAMKVRYLIVIGGDGTIYRVLNTLLDMMPAEDFPVILPLKGGTANAIVSSMGLTRRAHILLDVFLDAAKKDASGELPISLKKHGTLKVHDSTDGKTRHGFGFLNGIAYRVIKEYFDKENYVFMDAVKAGARPLLEWFVRRDGNGYFESDPMRINNSGGIIADGDINIVFATTLDRLLLLYSPFKEELNGTPGYHCIVNSMPISAVFRNFVSLARGRIEIDGHYNEILDESLTIESSSGYSIDGELFHRSEPYRVTISPGPMIRYPDL